MIKAQISSESISSNSQDAFLFFDKNNLGERKGDKIVYSIYEAIYLIEKKKMELIPKKTKEDLIKKFSRNDKRILAKYLVFKDLKDKNYTVKTALKFGADFRVYAKGKKPSEDHSKWVVFVNNENEKLNWHDFVAKNRVAHSTKKKLLLGIVDEEEDITYYEVDWTKP